MKVAAQPGVVFLDDDPGGLLHRLGPDSSLRTRPRITGLHLSPGQNVNVVSSNFRQENLNGFRHRKVPLYVENIGGSSYG